MRPVRVIKAPRKKGKRQFYMMSLNPDIGDVIPEEARFIPELTEEGILFRHVKESQIVPPLWARED